MDTALVVAAKARSVPGGVLSNLKNDACAQASACKHGLCNGKQGKKTLRQSGSLWLVESETVQMLWRGLSSFGPLHQHDHDQCLQMLADPH